MPMQTLVSAINDMPHGQRWMICPDLNRVYVSADLPLVEQWEAVMEAVAEMRATSATSLSSAVRNAYRQH